MDSLYMYNKYAMLVKQFMTVDMCPWPDEWYLCEELFIHLSLRIT